MIENTRHGRSNILISTHPQQNLKYSRLYGVFHIKWNVVLLMTFFFLQGVLPTRPGIIRDASAKEVTPAGVVSGPVDAAGHAARTLEAYLNRAREKTIFIPPSPATLGQAEKLFYRLLTAPPGPEQIRAWKAMHFSLAPIRSNGRSFFLLTEDAGHRTGRGMYVFPVHTDAGTGRQPAGQVLMVPHSLHDFHTADIGTALAEEGRFQAALFNTLHRYGNRKIKKKAGEQDTSWDMAARPDTFFTAFTRAFTAAFPGGTLVQIHGFSKKKRKTAAGRNADMILSAGTRSACCRVQGLTTCLRHALDGDIRAYPDDVRELGGTRNIIGAILRRTGHDGFLHIEMSGSMRKKIKRDPAMRRSFLNCLEEF